MAKKKKKKFNTQRFVAIIILIGTIASLIAGMFMI